jgi:DNA-binding CsgD family transcriptional regulator
MVESSPSVIGALSGDFLIDATTCTTAEALDQRFLRFVQALGFNAAMFVHLSTGGAPISPRVVFGDKNPWIEHYAAQNFARLDPTISRAFRSRQAFTWEQAERRDGPRDERRFFGEAREVWAKDGLIVPIHGPFGEFSVVNLLCDHRIVFTGEQTAMLKGMCTVYASLGLNFADGALAAPATPTPRLSRRELQCLFWMAMGKHDGETGIILGISIHTVREYLDSAKVKLGVETRPELSLRALACGLLVPDRGMMG